MIGSDHPRWEIQGLTEYGAFLKDRLTYYLLARSTCGEANPSREGSFYDLMILLELVTSTTGGWELIDIHA